MIFFTPERGQVIKVNHKIFKILYRLMLPGSLLLVFTALLIRVGVLADPHSQIVRFFPAAVFGIGLALSAFFRRSRLFFALLALALAQSTFQWVMPHLLHGAAQITRNAVAILLPLNLLVLAFLRERGIISPAGRRRLAFVALQIMSVAILCMPATGANCRATESHLCSGCIHSMERAFTAGAAGISGGDSRNYGSAGAPL